VKPPEPFVWFIDRSLGRRIATDLRAAEFQVEEHAEHYAADRAIALTTRAMFSSVGFPPGASIR
jgi:hypothetical protein